MKNDSLNKFETDRITNGIEIFFKEFHDKHSLVPSHWHKAIEINYILEGSLDIIINNNTTTLFPGDVYLIDSIIPHSTSIVAIATTGKTS